MKTVEYRKQISKGIKDGSIVIENKHLIAPSKVIRNLSKDMCKEVISDGCFNLANYQDIIDRENGDMHSSSSSANNGSDGSDGTNGSDGANSNSNASSDNSDNSNSSGANSDNNSDGGSSSKPKGNYQVFTTDNAKSLDELKSDLNIGNMQSDEIDKLVNVAKSQLSEIESKFDSVDDFLQELIDKSQIPRKVEINLNGDVLKMDDEHYHPKFDTIVKYAKMRSNVMLVGDSGSGKTFVAKQVADALDLTFGYISCSMGMQEAVLQGYQTVKGDYISTDFLNIYENGGVFLLDEFDSCDANVLMVINSALANGSFSVPRRKNKPYAKRHKDCIVLVAGNTWGNGNGSRKFSGRGTIDGATLDRFLKVYFDYDNSLERKLVGEHENAYNFLIELRELVKEKRLATKIVSTRRFEDANMFLSNGETLEDFANQMCCDWTEQEKNIVEFDSLISKHSK